MKKLEEATLQFMLTLLAEAVAPWSRRVFAPLQWMMPMLRWTWLSQAPPPILFLPSKVLFNDSWDLLHVKR